MPKDQNRMEINICLELLRVLFSFLNFYDCILVHFTFRIWLWVKDPTDDDTSPFNWSRDSIYGATFLMGAGGATVLVISQSMIAYLIGQYTVRLCSVIYRVEFSVPT